MGEVLVDPSVQQPSVSPEQGIPDGSLSYRERLRLGLGRLIDRSMSMVDLAAGIALARDDLRLTRNAMRRLDEPYDGIIERQAAADRLSMELESDIILDFRRDAQRAGFTDVDTMPTEQRAAVAQQSIGARTDDVSAELAAFHPDWSTEEVQEAAARRIADISVLFSMSPEERDAYLAAQLEYHELQTAIPEIQSTLSELRAERNERVSRIGSVALRGVVNFAGRVRDLPNALSARAMIAGMSVGDRFRAMSAEKQRKTLWGTAAGVALAGLASYVAMRHGIGSGSGNSNYTLASSNTTVLPGHVGTSLPTHVGTPSHIGSFTIPNHVGTPAPTPNHVGSIVPNHVGTAAAVPTPNHTGTALPNHVGATATPNHVGSGASTLPNHVGGGGVLDAQKSSELFTGSGTVDAWPDTITVSQWNPRDLDGSLTGISRQMLIRSGVPHPTEPQVNALINALRPQAQPNGYLLQGQKLDLRPATKVLHGILNK